MENTQYSILLVDNESRNLRSFKSTFSPYYTIRTASTGTEGLKILKKENFQLIITNQRMLQMPAVEFIEKARKNRPDVPYILLTENSNDDLTGFASEFNIRQYASKPFDPNGMKSLIELSLIVFQLRQDKRQLHDKVIVCKNRLQKIVDAAPDAIITTNEKQNIVMANPASETIFGYEKGSLIGQPITMLIPLEYRKEYREKAKNFINSKLNAEDMGKEIPLMALSSAGNKIPIETSLSKIDIEGELYINAIIRDVSKREKAEKLLRESEEEYRLLAENSPVKILKVNRNMVIEYTNHVSESTESVVGQSLLNYTPPDDREKVQRTLEKVFENGTPAYYEVFGESPNGDLAWHASNVGAIKKDGKITSILLVVQDISEKKKSENLMLKLNNELEISVAERTKELQTAREELEEALKNEKELGKLKSQFVSRASHQFRTPLTIIQSNMGLLSLQIDNKEGIDDAIKQAFEKANCRILSQIDRMTRMMNKVLTLGEINAETTQLDLMPLDLVNLSREIIGNYNEIQDDKREMTLTILGEPTFLKLDSRLFSHAISNFVSNAFKYSQGRPAPEMKLVFKENSIQIAIIDHGLGIPEEDLAFLFEPFFRASNVGEISGTGLGTSIAKEYIELNLGSIEVNSTINIGTEFILTFKK
tara:strand:- start:17965 stop:19917 length:1953 start_codon:yes stop_codon:yes gene_type:complete